MELERDSEPQDAKVAAKIHGIPAPGERPDLHQPQRRLPRTDVGLGASHRNITAHDKRQPDSQDDRSSHVEHGDRKPSRIVRQREKLLEDVADQQCPQRQQRGKHPLRRDGLCRRVLLDLLVLDQHRGIFSWWRWSG